jgi:cytochrome c peroxidase
LLAGCAARQEAPVGEVEIDPDLVKNFQPAPAVMENPKNPVTEEKVKLGRVLYFDPRLSAGGDVSCNTCHPLDRYGVDQQPVSTGHKGQKGTRNAPTTYHAAAQVVQFWDGRAADVEEQAKGPVLNPVEMAMADAAAVEAVLRGKPEYVALFRAAFPQEKQPVTFDNAALAIAAFERKLVTRSRWDRYLEGDRGALSNEEKAGFIAFHRAGCVACHTGAQLGGKFYIKMGMARPWSNEKDLGRFGVTKQEHHKMVFKVPVLRNVEKTGPYLHDGSVAELEEAVRLMGELQIEKPLTDSEVRRIVAWLKCLTGELPGDYIAPPKLPE